MNADRNWERNEPNERDSRGGPQRGFQYSDAYGPGGGAAGNKIINDIHCKNATFDQQGFPDGAQLLPDEQGGGNGGPERGRGHGQGHGRGRDGRDEGPRGRFDDERDEREGPGGPGGQSEHGQHGRWENGGHGGRGGHGGHRGHHGRGGPPVDELDANGDPIAGSVEANEMGMNAPPPLDANGHPIYQTMAQPVDYSSQSFNSQTQPMDYSAPQTQPMDYSAPQTQPMDYSAPPAQPVDFSTPQAQPYSALQAQPAASQSFDASGAPLPPTADATLAQITQADPTMGQFIGALQQAGMSQSTFSSVETTVAQNLANGMDDGSSLQQVMQNLQQNPNLQQDNQIFQQVLGSFQQPSIGDTSGTTSDTTGTLSDATAQSSTPEPSAYASSAYSTPTSAAV